MVLQARVDTGAAICSVHCKAVETENASTDAKANIGKRMRLLLHDEEGQDYWISATIADHAIIRTSDNVEKRFLVCFTLQTRGVKKNVRVSLNNRKKMDQPVLLGRNFLRHDFLVDVDLVCDDVE